MAVWISVLLLSKAGGLSGSGAILESGADYLMGTVAPLIHQVIFVLNYK